MKNRKTILLVLFTLVISNLLAQNQAEKFCRVDVILKLKKINITNIDIDFGKNNSFKDTTIITNLEKVKLLDNSIDALNYMEQLGWELVTIVAHKALYSGELGREVYFFRKKFEKTGLQ